MAAWLWNNPVYCAFLAEVDRWVEVERKCEGSIMVSVFVAIWGVWRGGAGRGGVGFDAVLCECNWCQQVARRTGH
jgi:hypothetical protein